MNQVKTSCFVTYRRVSTTEQGRSGLGLEAQQRDLDLFLAQHPEATVVGTYTEVVSGGKGEQKRPVLAEALRHCRQAKAVLLVSKLDRLSRNVAFIANLLEDKTVEFTVASLPQASRFELHLYAALAEQERTFISQRTKAALAAAKERGVQLGGPRQYLETENTRRADEALQNAQAVASLVVPLRQGGATLQEVADALNGGGVLTPRGKEWRPTQVKRVLERLDEVGVGLHGEAETYKSCSV